MLEDPFHVWSSVTGVQSMSDPKVSKFSPHIEWKPMDTWAEDR